MAAGDLARPEGDQTLGAQHEVVGSLGRDGCPRPHEEPLRVGVVDLEHPVGGVSIAVQILVALSGLGRDEGHDRPGHVHRVRGLTHVGPARSARYAHRVDLHYALGGLAVAIQVRVPLAGLRDESGKPPVGEGNGRRRPSEVLRLARAGPQVHDVVRRVAVAVQIDTAGLPGRPGCFWPEERGGTVGDGDRIRGTQCEGRGARSTGVKDPEDRIVKIAITGEIRGEIGRIDPPDGDTEVLKGSEMAIC